jgi:formylmethanofuran dehydrogenase subunit D
LGIELVVKRVPVVTDAAKFNVSDLNNLGVKSGEEVELTAGARAWTVKAEIADVPAGTAGVNDATMKKLGVSEGDKVIADKPLKVFYEEPVP